MERGASERINGNEVVVGLVNVLVKNGYFVQDSVSPVDHKLTDGDKQNHGNRNPSPAVLFDVVINLAILGEVTSINPRSSQTRRTNAVKQVPLDLKYARVNNLVKSDGEVRFGITRICY